MDTDREGYVTPCITGNTSTGGVSTTGGYGYGYGGYGAYSAYSY